MNRAERRRGAEATSRKQPKDRRRVILFATLGLVALLILAGVVWGSRTPQLASEAPTLAQLTVGQVAPPFTVSTTAGPFSLPNAQKKPVLLEVFATWCPHCQHEVPILNKLFDQYGKRVNLVAVSGSPYAMNETSPTSAADVVAFMNRFKTRYPVAYDPELKVMKSYLQGGYPTVVIIGSDGKIRAIHDGEITQQTLTKDLDDALRA
jgi:cytochrome c biogenesis protein CcmG, thiol:disulfide interchange protein DsbE